MAEFLPLIIDQLDSAIFADELSVLTKDEMHRLKEDLAVVRDVISKVEQMQFVKHEFRFRMQEITECLFSIENLLDEFRCEALRQQIVNRGKITEKVRRFFSRSNPLVFRRKMGSKLMLLRRRLEDVKYLIILHEAGSLQLESCSRIIERTPSHSFVVQSDVIGRDLDKAKIIELLTGPTYDRSPVVVSIVGMGGIGKTTLAKLVYNDKKIMEHFDLRIWVCVSDYFNPEQVFENIIGSATHHGVLHSDVGLSSTYLTLLKNKKFLLVLDDLWEENRERWIDFFSLLMIGGAEGSSIIVTTRSERVARIVGASFIHHIHGLSEEDSLQLFQRVFGYSNIKSLENVKEMVGACRGLPLAVRALGGLLRSTGDIYWESIKLPIHGEILPVLKLSYDHLPANLKRCFALCAVFPKDYVFKNTLLCSFWLANRLVDPSQKDQEPEVVADQCIRDLCSRSFFQELEDRGIFYQFKVHDLIHDLAVMVAEKECSIIGSSYPRVHASTKHLAFSDTSFMDKLGEQKNTYLGMAKNLQSILFLSPGQSNAHILNACITEAKYLRVLSSPDSGLEEIPRSICNLKHLRFLDLSGNHRIRRLPRSICDLQNLQFLGLARCWGLEALPKDMSKLINMRTLSITTKQKTLSKTGIEHLNLLQNLSIEGCNNLESLFEGMDLAGLSHLRILHIDGCASLTSIPFSSLPQLVSLDFLSIYDCERLDLSFGIIPLKLRRLYIGKLPSMLTLPEWIVGSAGTLEVIGIRSCPELMELPAWLGEISILNRLEIIGCPKILSFPCGLKGHTGLKHLEIEDCLELAESCQPVGGLDWPKIAHIPEIVIDGKLVQE